MSINNKSLLSFVLDVSISMGAPLVLNNHLPDSSSLDVSKLQFCKDFLNTYMCIRCAESKTIEFSATTYGQDPVTNENHLHQSGAADGYENVHELFKMCHPGQDIYELVQEQQPGPIEGSADLVPALIVAFDAIVSAHKKLAYNRVLVIITDGENPICRSDEDIEDLNSLVGNAAEADPDKSSKRGAVPIHAILLGKSQKHPREGDVANLNKTRNVSLLRGIAQRTGGTFIEADNAAEVLWALSHGTGLGPRPQLQKTVLRFPATGAAEGLDIPCAQWALTQEKSPLYLQKKWDERGARESRTWLRQRTAALSQDTSPAPTSRQMLSAIASDAEAADSVYEPGIRDIIRDITYVHPDDPQAEITFDSFVEGFKYGEYCIPVDSGSKRAMQVENSMGLTVLGFLPAGSVARHHYMDAAWVVQGSDMVSESQLGIAALARAMRRMQRVLVAKRVTKENDDPYLVVLSPMPLMGEPGQQPEEKDANTTLLMHRLPCADDSRPYTFPSLPDIQSKEFEHYLPGTVALSSFVDRLTTDVIPAMHLTPSNAGNYRLFSTLVARMMGHFMPHNSSDVSAPRAATDHLQLPCEALAHNDIGLPSKTVAGHKRAVWDAAQRVARAFPLRKPKPVKVRKEKTYFSTMQLEAEARSELLKRKAAESAGLPAARSMRASTDGCGEAGDTQPWPTAPLSAGSAVMIKAEP